MCKPVLLNTTKRSLLMQQLQNTVFDVVVIGGGITGAGIALDAAARGLKVALLEKQDFAAGTSSRSTKLIHGGLRYLKNLEFGLVREVGTERAILHRNAPHIVHAQKMLLPIYRNGSLGKHTTSLGLWLYDKLAGVVPAERRSMLTANTTLAAEPLLQARNLLGGGLYYEYQTDDARLTIEVLKTAAKHKAVVLNYLKVEKYHYYQQQINGLTATCQITGQTVNVSAHCVVNAGGPWADRLRALDGALSKKQLQLTKGVHIVVPRHRLPLQQAIYADTPYADGRMFFAIPRGNTAYIGTTDTNYDGSLTNPQVTQADIAYLIGALQAVFPDAQLTQADIVSSWAGLRPLIYEQGKSPSELSRKDEIFISQNGLITIAGGKLTGYRKMAERVVDKVMIRLHRQHQCAIRLSGTKTLRLSGSFSRQAQNLNDLTQYYLAHYQEIAGLTETTVKSLVEKYGGNTRHILRSLKCATFHPEKPLNERILLSELRYCVLREMVTTPADFLIRRTSRLYFERETCPYLLPLVINELASILQYTPAQKQQALMAWQKQYEAVLKFDDKDDTAINFEKFDLMIELEK
ncbi:MAG: glycerol-3-phosphate dehydrogenase/oxidase [Sphingobacteriales bacterium]|jgi:glycerol-3-phosphate dehydrogenase|nr:glycerol-3-phosphate dehydrogenase/oxidase [Sphingobacteriales bacterium]MBP9140381.1 glycerol-3-phosphate dehydrogenase/oxidase [Chitinophagales bacterium]MDA0197353.1 glycerol-3-phosphate dehydrogenase/oxidase [Bacteroidota bacterium]MBK7527405.1 glycerol-3-phosphate dehydrogenase/oxidase [Sphingobacteriales bacterium]MBK8678245.1 glycerol-3-phosphate dehydrogenase/oxidase [Sphingobacteriales bacterium]